MAPVYDQASDLYFGNVTRDPDKWREQEEPSDPDDELLDSTPDVTAILGFDPLDLFDEPFLSEKNCGIGPGGFQPGNTCARGGGGSAVDVEKLKAEYQTILEKKKENQKEYDRLYEIHKNDNPDIRASAFADLKRVEGKRIRYEEDMATLRMTAEAAHPHEFRQSRDEFNDKMDAWKEQEVALIERMVSDGVRNKKYFNDFTAFRFDQSAMFADKNRILQDYPGITEEHMHAAAELMKSKPNEEDYKQIWKSAYYDEPETPRNLGGVLSHVVDKAVPPKVNKTMIDENPTLENYAADAKVNIQMKVAGFEALVKSKDGYLKNGFQRGAVGSIAKDEEGNTKEGYFKSRKEGEEAVLGIPISITASERPIYGYTSHPDRQASNGAGISGHYGAVQIVLKDHVKNKTSVTFGDSLDDAWKNKMHAIALSSPGDPSSKRNIVTSRWDDSIGEFRPGTANTESKPRQDTNGNWHLDILSKEQPDLDRSYRVGYVEAQIHGGLSLKDVQEVRMPKHYSNSLSDSTKQKMQDLGIPLIETRPAMVLSTYDKPWDQAMHQDWIK